MSTHHMQPRATLAPGSVIARPWAALCGRAQSAAFDDRRDRLCGASGGDAQEGAQVLRQRLGMLALQAAHFFIGDALRQKIKKADAPCVSVFLPPPTWEIALVRSRDFNPTGRG